MSKSNFSPSTKKVAKKPTEAEIIVKMRTALDTLKAKFMENEGSWVLLDFMSAAEDKSHWMHQVVEAENLSKPYMKKAKK